MTSTDTPTERITAYLDAVARAHPDATVIDIEAKSWLAIADVRALLAENQWLDREAAQWQSAFERLHARVHRDFNFDAAESAAPDDEYWARLMDDLVIYADEVHPEIETGTVPSSTDNERR